MVHLRYTVLAAFLVLGTAVLAVPISMANSEGPTSILVARGGGTPQGEVPVQSHSQSQVTILFKGQPEEF
ncbi:hypothetical protein J3R30DRAFT_3707511 [Lentinula aciculospora]|uniref:Uncharacterized protein n=1 Tax=Lentinula aciculospora TaxID=153920 RepID=A0A9W9DKR6_9AGAR|nr:hypothetical protein J3R30DRAFT_3707511 [Lentinula aciculospora]